MGTGDLLHFTARIELIPTEFTDRLQHPELRRVSAIRVSQNKGLLDQPGEKVKDRGPHRCRSFPNSPRRNRIPTADTDRHSSEQRLFVQMKDAVAPIDRLADRALALGSTRSRAAASSRARGKPSRRRQIAAIAVTLARVMWNDGVEAWARSTKSWTALDRLISSRSGRGVSSGTVSGPTGYSRSPRRRNGARLVTSTVRSQGDDFLGGVKQVLEVIKDQQHPPLLKASP